MLVFGKQFTKNNSNKIGGVIKLFELFKDELKHNNIEYEVVDLNWRNYLNPVFAYCFIIYSIIFKIRKHSLISFHGTANEFIYLAPLVVYLGKLFNKNVCLRKFAGNFDEIYLSANSLKKKLIEYALINSQHNFFETRYLVEFFNQFNNSTSWFPNVRKKQDLSSMSIYKKKFVFIGHLIKEKGLDELIEAFSKLGNNYSLVIYGPPSSEFNKNSFILDNIFYKGVLDATEVCSVLKNYDLLILPSYREGYPGVIIEAFSVGVPVIATALEGIKEMVENLYNGLLIEPRDSDSLYEAIVSLDEMLVIELKKNAKKSFGNYDSRIVTKQIIQKMAI